LSADPAEPLQTCSPVVPGVVPRVAVARVLALTRALAVGGCLRGLDRGSGGVALGERVGAGRTDLLQDGRAVLG
jgi:hypothetical protein